MTRSPKVPLLVRRALYDGETVVAFVRAGRRGARESKRAQTVASFVGMWAGFLVRKATEKSLGGVSVPLTCWLVATDRRLLVTATTPYGREAKLSRSVVYSRVRGAKLRTPNEKMSFARIALMDNRDLELEVRSADLPALTAVVNAVQAAAAEQGANRPSSYRTVMG